MNEKEKVSLVDYEDIKGEIIAKADSLGAATDMECWREAFPEIDFMEVDETFSGAEVCWEKRTIAEKAFFVAYMKSPQDTEVSFCMRVEDLTLTKRIHDSESIWWMWMAGCFSGEELDEKALRTFLWYVGGSDLARKYILDVDLGSVEVLDLEALVARV